MRAAGNMEEPPNHPVHPSQPQTIAQPLHIQRLEASLDMGPFMNYAQNMLLRPLTSSEDSDSDDGNVDFGLNGFPANGHGKMN